MNKDNPPSIESLEEVPFTHAVPDVSWYRHQNWPAGQFKRFRHFHTMSQDITGFKFYSDHDQAKQRCKDFNDNRTAVQRRNGTMMEFTAQ